MFSDYKLDNIIKLFFCVGFFIEIILNFNEIWYKFFRKGDYYRYFVEFVIGIDRKDVVEFSLVVYKVVSDIAMVDF